MNPALQAQLEKLGRTLAKKNNQSIALFELPKGGRETTPNPPSRAAESVAEAAEPVLRKAIAAQPLQEAVASFSARQVARVVSLLKPLALRIYTCLNLLGCHVAHTRGYHPKACQVSYFCPAEAIYAHLDIKKGSFYRSLKELIALGLVARKGHKTSLGKRVRDDGTLWSIKLVPTTSSKARLRFEDLKASYRDLEADIEAGNTVWQQIKQSKTDKAKPVTFEMLTRWALSPQLGQIPFTAVAVSEPKLELEILLDVPRLPRHGRRVGVDKAARALCQHLADAKSLNFYRQLVWQMLRLSQQGREYFGAVYTMILRTKADLAEGFARKAGALFVSRLKACGLWDELREVSLVRVAA